MPYPMSGLGCPHRRGAAYTRVRPPTSSRGCDVPFRCPHRRRNACVVVWRPNPVFGEFVSSLGVLITNVDVGRSASLWDARIVVWYPNSGSGHWGVSYRSSRAGLVVTGCPNASVGHFASLWVVCVFMGYPKPYIWAFCVFVGLFCT